MFDNLTDEAIESALKTIRARIARNEESCAEIRLQTARDREEERLLARLLNVRRGQAATTSISPKVQTEVSSTDEKPSAAEAVAEELAAAGRPLHISELMRLLAERRVALPGAGAQANLIIHLRRDERFVRPSRGMYALSSWGLENMLVVRRNRGKKRVRVTVGGGKD